MNPNRIRIPTKDAPAAHHLTFICAVTELTQRLLEKVTGLDIELKASIHDHTNIARIPALVEAAKAAELPYREHNETAWYFWKPSRFSNAGVTVFTRPAVTIEPETNTEERQYHDALAEVDSEGVTLRERLARR